LRQVTCCLLCCRSVRCLCCHQTAGQPANMILQVTPHPALAPLLPSMHQVEPPRRSTSGNQCQWHTPLACLLQGCSVSVGHDAAGSSQRPATALRRARALPPTSNQGAHATPSTRQQHTRDCRGDQPQVLLQSFTSHCKPRLPSAAACRLAGEQHAGGGHSANPRCRAAASSTTVPTSQPPFSEGRRHSECSGLHQNRKESQRMQGCNGHRRG
jgi:hypothetical protein